MADATISCARGALWRVWAAPGSASRPLRGLPAAPSASSRLATTDAASIGGAQTSRPRAARARPETDDLTASTIWCAVTSSFVDRLAAARIGDTFNQYADSQLRRDRLAAYLAAKSDARLLLVAEAPGYRGTRISGIPLTSERQLTGAGPAEATATIVHRTLEELEIAADVLLWNLVPTHPGTEASNRPPTRAEIEAGEPFLAELAEGRRVVAVGRLAHRRLGGPYVRHPSRGGASAFRYGLMTALA